MFTPFYVKNDNSYIIMVWMFMKGIFLRNGLQKILIKNKWTINNFYLFIWTHPFDTFVPVVSFVNFSSTKTHKLCKELSSKHLFQVWFQLVLRRRLKCKSLRMTTPTSTDVQGWQYFIWAFRSGKLINTLFYETTNIIKLKPCMNNHLMVSCKVPDVGLNSKIFLITRITRRVPLVEQELLTIPKHASSSRLLVGFVLLDL